MAHVGVGPLPGSQASQSLCFIPLNGSWLINVSDCARPETLKLGTFTGTHGREKFFIKMAHCSILNIDLVMPGVPDGELGSEKPTWRKAEIREMERQMTYRDRAPGSNHT